MPTVTEEVVQGWAHCNQSRCPGNQQQPVEAVRRETAHTYRERGGNAPGVESSFVTLTFADEDERHCPHCGGPREVSDQQRKRYAPLSGHDPMGLLGVPEFDAGRQAERAAAPVSNPEREEMLARIEELRGQVAALAAARAEGDPPEERSG